MWFVHTYFVILSVQLLTSGIVLGDLHIRIEGDQRFGHQGAVRTFDVGWIEIRRAMGTGALHFNI